MSSVFLREKKCEKKQKAEGNFFFHNFLFYDLNANINILLIYINLLLNM